MIELLGDKVKAKQTAVKNKIPVIPGSEDPVDHEDQAVKHAKEIGFPIIIKAAAGGGGKGMRIVRNEKELKALFFLEKEIGLLILFTLSL